MIPAHTRTRSLDLAGWLLALVALIAWCGLLWYKLHFLSHGGHQIDDSYMFIRYARNLRAGLGMSWNRDGVHTYGTTTLLWAWIIIPFSMLPGDPAIALTLASWITTACACAACACAIGINRRSTIFGNRLLLLAVVALGLMTASMFDYASVSGMETMLAFALLALIVGMVLRQQAKPVSAELIGLLAFLLYLTRPESALAAVLLIALAPVFLKPMRWSASLRALAVLFALTALSLLLCRWYFGTPLPLPFYIKARHLYVGYRQRWYPFTYFLTGLRMCTLFTLMLCLFARRSLRGVLALCLLPWLAVCLYLCTVTQIMGFHDRYFEPYMPLLAVPAFLALDRWLAERHWLAGRFGIAGGNAIAAVCVLLFAAGAFPYSLQVLAERQTERAVGAYAPLVFGTETHPAPAAEYFAAMNGFTEGVAPYLPPGTVVAASEVGKLGVTAPSIRIIDTGGLNDRQIALHGFHPEALLAQKPDVIWMPHDDYTWERGTLMTDPHFLQQYDLYAGAFNYGLAVRKSSAVAPIVEQRLAAVWPTLYPGTTPADALVHSIRWPSGVTRIPVSPPSYAHRES